ncbi:MAG: hypothetical protein DRP35_05585, partial [Candidatus Zixiibacteriota bacterium]
KDKFNSENSEKIKELLDSEQVGYLGILTNDKYPRVIPVNFCAIKNIIYFHGALEGEKYKLFETTPKVTFAVVCQYSLIPSYWISPNYACTSTIFYKSALIKGTGYIVGDLTEKAVALQSLMEKHQPEGGFNSIDENDKLYQKPLKETGIFKIIPDKIDYRRKFGDYLPRKTREILVEKLLERNKGLDSKTAKELQDCL